MPTNCDNTVERAAPLMPHSSTKIQIGARITLQPTVSIDESIAFWDIPWHA